MTRKRKGEIRRSGFPGWCYPRLTLNKSRKGPWTRGEYLLEVVCQIRLMRWEWRCENGPGVYPYGIDGTILAAMEGMPEADLFRRLTEAEYARRKGPASSGAFPEDMWIEIRGRGRVVVRPTAEEAEKQARREDEARRRA